MIFTVFQELNPFTCQELAGKLIRQCLALKSYWSFFKQNKYFSQIRNCLPFSPVSCRYLGHCGQLRKTASASKLYCSKVCWFCAIWCSHLLKKKISEEKRNAFCHAESLSYTIANGWMKGWLCNKTEFWNLHSVLA